MLPLQILIPMGGLGQRFRDQGYATPKPLIEVNGKPLFLQALSSFDAYDGPKEHVFVVRADAEDEFGLASSIQKLLPSAHIKIMTKDTQGAAETCLLAKDDIDNKKPLVIMDCDFRFSSRRYFERVKHMAQTQEYDGVLLSFESSDPRYSYAMVNEYDQVIATAEKQVISTHALAGAYAFLHGSLFVDVATSLVQEPLGESMNEYYISYVYSRLIQEDKHITLAHIDTYDSFGTPEELLAFQKSQGMQ